MKPKKATFNHWKRKLDSVDLFFKRLSDVCHEALLDHGKLMDYLEKRKIGIKTIQKYNLGLFPKDLRYLLSKISPEELVERGIIWNASESPFKNEKAYYPLVIPIQDTYNNFVAIGCRTLLNDEKRKQVGAPKYKNTEYQKTSYLYGLNHAIEDIRRKNKVFVVEGYFDVISCHQSGFKNVVATCGTLFSKKQLIILSRYTDNIVLLFDNDTPGVISAKRVMDKFATHTYLDVNLSCQFTPEGFKDIDEYLRNGGDYRVIAEKEDKM